MEIAVVGTGYVGLVVGACLADLGNRVICVDVDEKKIEMLKRGESPIYEPGLDELLERNIGKQRLSFTTDIERAVKESSIIFIAVGTPQGKNGKADLKYVKQAAESIGKAMNGEKIIVNKSTVPIGTGKMVEKIIGQHFKGKFHVVSNPEFLREGSAINDFLQPDRIVIGNSDKKAAKKMEELYRPLNAKILFTDVESAELIKYASNAFLATKISFINEIAKLCDKVKADVQMVAKGVGLDKRIGPYFLRAGCGWGGSCFPKDVSALIEIGKQFGVEFLIPKAAEEVNKQQKFLPVKKAEKLLGSLKGKTITVLGLAFKPGTDDMREAPSIEIIRELLKKGAKVNAFDPIAEKEARKIFPSINYFDSVYSALEDSDAVLLITEWNEFKEMDFEKVKKTMNKPIIIDGRNIYDRKTLEKAGFKYEGIGV